MFIYFYSDEVHQSMFLRDLNFKVYFQQAQEPNLQQTQESPTARLPRVWKLQPDDPEAINIAWTKTKWSSV